MTSPNLPQPFLHGVALFNTEQFFAAHEAWEELWLTAAGAERQFLHALIQTAAALHHVQRGNLTGAASVWAKAQRKFNALPLTAQLFDATTFVAECERYFARALASAAHQLPFPKFHLNYDGKA